MLILALAIAQPVAAQSFKPDWDAGHAAFKQKDYATALRHWRPLAKQGDADAQLWLGSMYEYGWGVTKDLKKAVRWYRLAAKQGRAHVQVFLGEMYRDGLGVVQDLVMAYVWMNVSIANGSNWPPEKRDKALAKLNASERKLALELSKRCFKKPARCPEYSDD